MKIHKFLFSLLSLLLLSQYTYAGPSSFRFTFHNTDPDKTVYIWMSDYPRGGVAMHQEGRTIPYRGKSAFIIAQDPGQDSKDGIQGQWAIKVKDQNNKVYCAIQLIYRMQYGVEKSEVVGYTYQGKPMIHHYTELGWHQSIKFKKYEGYHICPHRNLAWQKMPKPEGKPKHGTRFYRVSIYLDELHTIYYMR